MNVHLTKHLPFCIKTHIYKEKDTLKCKLHELFGMNIYGSATLWFNTWRTNAGDCSLVPQAKNKTFFFHFSICFLYVYRFFSLFLFHSRLYDAFVGQVYLGAMSTLLFSSFYRVFYSDSLLYYTCSAMVRRHVLR